MLTWVLFLKFLDDHEQVREARAKMKREKYRPAVEAPYCWRDWAAPEDGVSGDALKHFINYDEAVRPEDVAVRLPVDFAKKLYSVTEVGTPVYIGA